MFSMREKDARSKMLAVRLTEEEMDAVKELADTLSGEQPGLYTPVDAARVAIGNFYKATVKTPGKDANPRKNR